MGTPPSSAMFKDYQPPLVMNDPVVKELAEKYKKNVGQVRVVDTAIVADISLPENILKQGAIPVFAQLWFVNAKSKVMLRNLSATSLLINAQDLPQVCMHLLFGSLWPGEAESLWLTYLEDEMMRYALNEIMGSDYAADLHTLAFLFFLPE